MRALCAFISLFSFYTWAGAEYSGPNVFRLSYVNHPEVTPLIPLFENIYAELGFDVVLLKTPIARGVKLLRNGLVDADIARLNVVMTNINDIIIVEPKLFDVRLSLICNAQVQCSKDVLSDPSVSILASMGARNLATRMGIVNSQLFINDKMGESLDMLRKGRIDYMLYPLAEGRSEAVTQGFNHIEFDAYSVHHILHKRHDAILPSVTKMLSQRLKQLPN